MALEGIFVQHFVFFLAYCQALLIRLVVLELVHYFSTLIECTNRLVLHGDAVRLALVDQLLVLFVTDLSFGTRLELLPGLLLNHGRICVHVLTLKADFLELLGEALVGLLLVLLLLLDLIVGFDKALLTHLSALLLERISSIILGLALSIIILSTLVARILNFRLGLLQVISFLVFASQVVLPLLLSILLDLAPVELDALAQLCDRHLLE